MTPHFWQGKRVLVTGHTGFKGSWLCLWLHQLGARVTGYALEPPTDPSLFELVRIKELLDGHEIADVRDFTALQAAMHRTCPEIVIHMAAQPLVRDSYRIPVETYATNVMGTVHLLESARNTDSVKAIVNVTTDKCYENREWAWGYRENEAMGGYDPYSSSKACSELVTAAYRRSYFEANEKAPKLASARAGNVIGGGDWANDRLIPDILRALLADGPVRIRNPHAIRPWQHVLEPLSGYLTLAQRLIEDGDAFTGAWNFGPHDQDARPVEWIVANMCNRWGQGADYEIDAGEHPHEAHFLKLDCSLAKSRLGWQPRWDLDTALETIVDWTRTYRDRGDIRQLCFDQIKRFENS